MQAVGQNLLFELVAGKTGHKTQNAQIYEYVHCKI